MKHSSRRTRHAMRHCSTGAATWASKSLICASSSAIRASFCWRSAFLEPESAVAHERTAARTIRQFLLGAPLAVLAIARSPPSRLSNPLLLPRIPAFRPGFSDQLSELSAEYAHHRQYLSLCNVVRDLLSVQLLLSTHTAARIGSLSLGIGTTSRRARLFQTWVSRRASSLCAFRFSVILKYSFSLASNRARSASNLEAQTQ